MKKIILDIILPAIIIMIFVVGGIFIAQKLGILSGGQAAPPTEVRTVDTPEYKALDSAYREREREVQFWYGYSKGLEEQYDRMEAIKNNSKIIYKNENKRIENNTANSNFDELRGIIQSRRSK